MSTSALGVCRPKTLPMNSLPVSLSPVISQLLDTPPLNPMATTLEHILATMARFESRLDDQDRRIAANQPPSRPEPDPPYCVTSGWRPEEGFPKFTPTAAVTMSIPSLPNSSGSVVSAAPFTQPWREHGFSNDNAEFIPRQPLGFHASGYSSADRHNPNGPVGFQRPHHGPRTSNPRPPSSCDPPNARAFNDPQPYRQGSSWDHPNTRQYAGANNFDQTRQIKMDPPYFDGSDAPSWISRVQYYFDHIMLPEEHRLHYVVMLFVPPVAEWIFNYRESNPHAQWLDFLEDVRRRFDPKCFVNYIGLLAKLCQTGTLAAFNAEYEGKMNRIKNLLESTLLLIYIEGLQQPVKNQVKFQYPTSVAAAMALAVEFDSVIERQPSQQAFCRRTWQPRDNR